MNTSEFKILHMPTAQDPFVVLYKPHGMPSAPITATGTNDAFSTAAALIPGLRNVRGKKEIEHGLLHRLDNDACGLLLIAATQQAYDALCDSQRAGRFKKTYRVFCMRNSENALLLGGFPPSPDVTVEAGKIITVCSAFRPFGEGRRQVRPVTSASGTAAGRKGGTEQYYTEVEISSIEKDTLAAYCRITAGYRHQVRCHLAWLGIPVAGDSLYNASCGINTILQFEGCSISFPHPLTGVTTHFTV